jgi:excinuclease UvrABC ATPase subunit
MMRVLHDSREAGMACTGCAGANVVSIRMRIAGEEIVFKRCSKCEVNRWADESGEITLDEVLELARSTR